VAWLVKVDGLVIYHNGDCQPGDPSSEYDFLKKKTAEIDLAFVFPVSKEGEKYTLQNRIFFKTFPIRAVFPMHATAGEAMYLEFQKAMGERLPALPVHIPLKMGHRFTFGRK